MCGRAVLPAHYRFLLGISSVDQGSESKIVDSATLFAYFLEGRVMVGYENIDFVLVCVWLLQGRLGVGFENGDLAFGFCMCCRRSIRGRIRTC